MAITSPISLSSKDIIAKPTICAQQPARAAPAANPSSPNIIPMAAEEIGAVSAIPINIPTTMDINNGCKETPSLIKPPIQVINCVK